MYARETDSTWVLVSLVSVVIARLSRSDGSPHRSGRWECSGTAVPSRAAGGCDTWECLLPVGIGCDHLGERLQLRGLTRVAEAKLLV